jgi:hypothetical protein
MPGSNFSIINGVDGLSKIPISTLANDANGNTVVGHLIMASIAGVATPVDSNHPLSVSVSALPLPAGAATDASLAAISAKLAQISSTLSAIQVSEAPYQGVVAMVVDQAQASQRAVRINCTTGGNVSLTYADGSKDVIPIAAGLNYVAGAVTTVNSAGTTAIATYANMK